MKKILILLFLCLMLTQCKESNDGKVLTPPPQRVFLVKSDYTSKIISDDRGCEYLVVITSEGGVAVTHLPLCRNHSEIR